MSPVGTLKGQGNVIDDNEVSGNCGDGIRIQGPFNEAPNNIVFDNGSDGISVDGDDNTIETGRVGGENEGNGGVGIRIVGSRNTVLEMGVLDNVLDGINVRGDDNKLVKNLAGERGAGNGSVGIVVDGSGNTLQENEAYANGSNGIEVRMGAQTNPNVLKKNKAGERGKGNRGHGIILRNDTGDGQFGKVELEENRTHANGRDAAGRALNCGGLACGVGLFVTRGSIGHTIKGNISGVVTPGGGVPPTADPRNNSACAFAIDKTAGPGPANRDAGSNRANGRAVNPLGIVRGIPVECVN